MNRIPHPLILEGHKVRLQPLDKSHFDELVALSKDPRIWEFMSVDGTDTNELITSLESALLQRAVGLEYPFVAIDKNTGKIFGSTRYMDILRHHRGLEIGWTWYHPSYWQTGYNRECKFLLLRYAFEELKVIRVQIKTWDQNLRSRAAIEKLGAKFEGILRNQIIRYDGKVRSTVYYSILDEEWPEVKQKLELTFIQS